MKKRLEGKVALITGGGSGIGAAIAKLFSQEDCLSIIVGRRLKVLEGVVETVVAEGYKAVCYTLDITDEDQVKKTIDRIALNYGEIDILVNNAGIINSSPEACENIGWDEIKSVLNINVYAPIGLTNHVLSRLIKAGKKGSVINIASICAHHGCAEYPTYSASKGALLSYTKAIAAKYARHFIRANSISPGIIHTPMSYVEMGDFDSQIIELNELHPLGRIGVPLDVAKAALFLSGDESEWITGQDIIVDGGWLLRE
jgi:NAD(P)-dependent dehydrogenase (short-subunit alcohol dehydrogenase family)